MQNLFNYTTLSTRLEKSTRTLFVTLNRPDWNNALKLEMLFELESLFAWCTSKVEINTIFIDSSSAEFSSGYDLQNLSELKPATLAKITTKLQKIIFAMMQLPQTIIVDLGQGSQTIASEFALGADIRISSEDARIQFNHAVYGLVPACGGMSMLSALVAPSFARSWVLSGSPISQKALCESGFIATTYTEETRESTIRENLQRIARLAPVQRIQAKLGLFESLRPQFEAGIIMDKKVSQAAHLSEDWRTKKSEDDFTFMPAKSMSYSVKLSLIKSEETRNLDH